MVEGKVLMRSKFFCEIKVKAFSCPFLFMLHAYEPETSWLKFFLLKHLQKYFKRTHYHLYSGNKATFYVAYCYDEYAHLHTYILVNITQICVVL